MTSSSADPPRPERRRPRPSGPPREVAGARSTAAVEEMAAAWRRGERPRAEEFLARHPGLGDEDAVRLIYEEACLRLEAGEEAVSAEILRRFPRWRLGAGAAARLRPAAADAAAEADFPEVGEDLGDFRLLAELGRGAHGRTFLASQRSLADRPVVLKVTPLGHDEHLSLARLQHMHIVPLYFEQVLPDRNLRVLCMPYLGGTTLARILDALRDVPPDQRDRARTSSRRSTGSSTASAARRSSAGRAVPEIPGAGLLRPGDLLDRRPAWPTRLQYAHDRGLVHMDVKPSNVLIAADGQPMLLDFHLARGPIGPGQPAPDRLGGTPGYMSPEQREAMAAIRAGPADRHAASTAAPTSTRWACCSTRRSAATTEVRRAAAPAAATAATRGSRRACSDIVRKCLARDPADRYPDAASLADDLRRHLNDLPLRGVPNRSLGRALAEVAAAAPGRPGPRPAPDRPRSRRSLAAGSATARRVDPAGPRQIDAALAEGREHRRRLAGIAEATRALDRGLRARRRPARRRPAEAGPARASLQRVQGRAGRRRAARPGRPPPLPLRHQPAHPGRGRVPLPARRGDLGVARPAHRTGRRPAGPEAEQQIRTDLLDLATIWADLRVRGGPPGRREAILREAVRSSATPRTSSARAPPSAATSGATPGPSAGPSLTAPADPDPADGLGALRPGPVLPPLGRARPRRGRVPPVGGAAAGRILAQLLPGGLRLSPRAATRTPRPSLSICVALAPGPPSATTTAPWPTRRSASPTGLGPTTPGRSTHPDFTDAALNRGRPRIPPRPPRRGVRDLEGALATSPAPAARGQILYNLALVQLARRDHAAAEASLRRDRRRRPAITRALRSNPWSLVEVKRVRIGVSVRVRVVRLRDLAADGEDAPGLAEPTRDVDPARHDRDRGRQPGRAAGCRPPCRCRRRRRQRPGRTRDRWHPGYPPGRLSRSACCSSSGSWAVGRGRAGSASLGPIARPAVDGPAPPQFSHLRPPC